MKYNLICLNMADEKHPHEIFSKELINLGSAYKAANRDFRLRCQQFGTTGSLPKLKDWSRTDNNYTVEAGMMLVYKMISVN